MAKKNSLKKTDLQKQIKIKPSLKPWITIGFLVLGVAAYFVFKSIYTLYLIPIDEDKSGWPLYKKYCSSCHGLSGEGQDRHVPKGGLLSDGSLLAPALNGSGNSWKYSNEELFEKIKRGSKVPNSPMMGVEMDVTDEGVELIIHHIKSLWPPLTQKIHENKFSPLKEKKKP